MKGYYKTTLFARCQIDKNRFDDDNQKAYNRRVVCLNLVK